MPSCRKEYSTLSLKSRFYIIFSLFYCTFQRSQMRALIHVDIMRLRVCQPSKDGTCFCSVLSIVVLQLVSTEKFFIIYINMPALRVSQAHLNAHLRTCLHKN